LRIRRGHTISRLAPLLRLTGSVLTLAMFIEFHVAMKTISIDKKPTGRERPIMKLTNRSPQLLMTISILVSLGASLSGCGVSYFASREDNPSIQDNFNRGTGFFYDLFPTRTVNTFATTASRRVIIVAEDRDAQQGQRLEVCAEPPPDVGEAFASALTTGLKAAVKEPKSGITAEGARNYASATTTQIAPLLYRTQGLQFLRDGLHSLCVDRMNGWFNGLADKSDATKAVTRRTGQNPKAQRVNNTNESKSTAELENKITQDATSYIALKSQLINASAELILKELPNMLEAQKEFYKDVKAGITPEQLQKIADIVKPVPATTTTTSTPSATTTTTTPNASPSK